MQRVALISGHTLPLHLSATHPQQLTSTARPILAGVITLAMSGTDALQAFTITLAYAAGIAVPVFGVMKGGRNLLARILALLTFSVVYSVVSVCCSLDSRSGWCPGGPQLSDTDRRPGYVRALTFLENVKGSRRQINRRLR